jgi:hypothetical protein
MATKKHRLWYVRRNEDIRGPFPTAVISQYLLLGRLNKNDEISRDQQEWMQIVNVVELAPEVMKADLAASGDDPNLEAAKRGADERSVHDRRQSDDPEYVGMRKGERRAEESSEDKAHRESRVSQRLEDVEKAAKKQNIILAIVLFIICGGLLSLVIIYQPEDDIPDIDCTAPPSPGINWSNCNFQGMKFDSVDLTMAHIRNANLSNVSLYRATLEGADLSYTNFGLANLRMSKLAGANLLGAILKNSDLRGADMRNVDLSYADLQGAQLAGINLEGAILNKTIWPDGEMCAEGSVGGCIPTNTTN